MPVRKNAILIVLIFLLTALVQAGWAENISDIRPQGYVTDLAGVIDTGTRQKIELLATEVEQKTGAQIAVVTVNSLEGQTRDEFAVALFKHLGVGAKRKDKGVLILIAPKDRQYKIEVGYGLEPVINDARAGDVGRTMVPDLRKGDYSAAALTGVAGVAQLIAADAGVTLTGMPQRAARPPTHEAPWWLPFVLFFGFFLLMRALARSGGSRRGPPPSGGGGVGGALPWFLMGNSMGRRGGGWGGGFGGSSGGWGGGGGGGFGGFGGGMSGGGGAGGSW